MISLWRQILTGRLSRQTSRWSASALLLTACSCSAVQSPLAKSAADPFLDDDRPAAVAALSDANPTDTVGRPENRNAGIVLAEYETETGPERRRGATSGFIREGIVRTGAERRLPDCDACPVFESCPPGDDNPTGCATRYPDEYLFDGGDHGTSLYLEDDQIRGLQAEDTAASYRDECLKPRLTRSNCVAVYSPRFAAVTTVSEPIEDIGSGRPTQAVGGRSGVGLVNRVGSFTQHQRDATERLVTRMRGSGLKTDVAADTFDRPIAIHGHIHTTTPRQDFGFLRTGQVQQTDELRLAASIQSAVAWTRDQNPVVAARTEGAVELKSRFQQQELVGRENRCRGRAMLRIVKLADKTAAQPGDIVTFTIRIDNIGDREVQDVVIVDNLTSRLEYIDDSATCDQKGILFTEDNGEGSLVLRWELDEPLAGGSGGVVTFQARVR